ncbi:MAG: universal stress protein [Actinomycetota bacterium]
MEIVVGVSPDESGDDAVALGAVLHRLLGARLLLTYVHPPTIDYPSLGNVDAEWEAFLRERADATLSEARHDLETEWSITDVDCVVYAHASVGHALRNVAEERGASLIAIGPGASRLDGRLSLGSVAHSLLHGGPAAVAAAPEGYRETAPDHIARLVAGFQDTEESVEAVQLCIDVAARNRIPVHLLTVVLRATRIVGARVGRDAERQVMQALIEREQEAQGRFTATRGEQITGSVVTGDTPERAMSRFDWEDSDLFVVASSSLGPVARVFLGDMTHKLLRVCTVPAIVLPRGYDGHLTEASSG